MVLMRYRRPEQRENSVAGRLRNIAAVMMDCIHHEIERRIDYGPRLFWIEVLNQLHRAFDVGEERRDRLALAFGNFVDKMLRAYSDIRSAVADGLFRLRG